MSSTGKPINPQKRLLVPGTNPSNVPVTPNGKIRLSDIDVSGELSGNVLTVTDIGLKAQPATGGTSYGIVAAGNVTLSGVGTATITTDLVDSATSVIQLNYVYLGGSPGHLYVVGIVDGVSFTIASTGGGADNGAIVSWVLIEETTAGA